MATVPDDQISTVQAEPIPGRAIPRFDTQASPQDFGAGLGEGLQQAANDVSMVQARQRQAQKEDDAWQERQTEKANADADRVRSAGYMQQILRAKTEGLYGKDSLDSNAPPDPDAAYRQTGKALATLPDTATAKFSTAVEDILKDAPPHIKAMLAEHVTDQTNDVHLQAKRYAFEQFNREKVQTFTNTISQETAVMGMDFRDPNSYDAHKQQILAAGQSLAESGGKDALKGYQESGYRKDLDGLVTSGIGGFLADNNVAGAQKFLNSHAADLSGGQKHEELANRIMAAGDRLDALNKDSARDRIADQRAAAIAGLPGWEKLAGQGDYGIVHKGDAGTQYAITQKMAAAGTAEKRFDQMPISDVQTSVLSSRPTEAKPGVAEDLHLQQFLEEAAQRSIRRRQEDPMGFAISTGQGPKPIDFTDQQGAATELRSRANTASTLSDRLGVPMPLLSKQESKDMTRSLAQMAPDKRLQSLAQLRETLPDDTSYANVLHSIAPNSPLTALAGASLDRPNKGDAPNWYDTRFAGTGPVGPVGQRTLEGEEILKDKSEKGIKSSVPMPPDKTTSQQPGLDTAFLDASGGKTSDLFRGRSELMQAKFAQFKAVYAADANKQGKLNGILDTGIAAQAARDVLGPVTTYNHSSVVVPSGMDPTKFEGAVNGASKAALKSAGYNDTDVGALRGYGLRELGDDFGTGRYVIINGRGDPLKDKANQNPVIIDLNQQYKGVNAPVPKQATHVAFAGKGGHSLSPRVENDGT